MAPALNSPATAYGYPAFLKLSSIEHRRARLVRFDSGPGRISKWVLFFPSVKVKQADRAAAEAERGAARKRFIKASSVVFKEQLVGVAARGPRLQIFVVCRQPLVRPRLGHRRKRFIYPLFASLIHPFVGTAYSNFTKT
ncbi:hypothetical protein EVAR_101110_1 [Eumeta japonica]|uniref:Uncharacterized protein n=1 Tax=Eumeta variegata TaxID=151549 RepID=A0A4C2A2U8_EUMVA|nr:hypothetical protein EVAR_101110_1 [Eumeta japonica]